MKKSSSLNSETIEAIPIHFVERDPVLRYIHEGMRLIILLVFTVSVQLCTHAQPRKTISRAELEDILSHSITIQLLNE